MQDSVGYLLKRVQSGLRAAMDGVLAARGLTTPQYWVLSWLEQAPGSSSAQLARRSFVTPQTMIRIVENLEALGLVARGAHPTHGKVLQVTLTPAGARLVASCHAEAAEAEARMLSRIGAADRATLRRLLAECAAALESS